MSKSNDPLNTSSTVFDLHLSVGIFRLQNGLDYSDKGGEQRDSISPLNRTCSEISEGEHVNYNTNKQQNT